MLGADISLNEVLDIFRRLGFEAKVKEKLITVSVPSRRIDIEIAEDLVEEVRTHLWSK